MPGKIFNLSGILLIKRTNGRTISLNKPELNILVNTLLDEIEVSSRSIFVMGKYVKNKRGINQKKQRKV